MKARKRVVTETLSQVILFKLHHTCRQILITIYSLAADGHSEIDYGCKWQGVITQSVG